MHAPTIVVSEHVSHRTLPKFGRTLQVLYPCLWPDLYGQHYFQEFVINAFVVIHKHDWYKLFDTILLMLAGAAVIRRHSNVSDCCHIFILSACHARKVPAK